MGFESLWAPAGNGPVELVVDLANVCRSEDLSDHGATSLGRLDALAEAWSRWEGAFAQPLVRLVADASLRHDLSRSDKQRLRAAEDSGYAEVHDYADPVILDHAEHHACLVISRDQFVGHRRERPWITTADDQFISWIVEAGSPRLSLATWPTRTDYSLSRAIERDELKGLGLDARSELLRFVHRCDNPACFRRAFAPRGAEFAPQPDAHGDPICPGCRRPLTVVGRRSDTALVKLRVHVASADEYLLLPLERGHLVELGRASNDVSLESLLPTVDQARLSRRHANLQFDGREVRICDLGSSNGTKIARWDREIRDRRTPVAIAEGVGVVVRPRDQVILGGVLVLERSGRRYPFDLDLDRSSTPTASPGSPSGLPTRM